ncbi:HD domain-containing protein [Fervidobacterium riparium]|uniref:HD-GYP domain-containing protein n=1 Tax=Fervidobacterium gondwanense TaxID=44754 RepID=UPI003A6DBCAB
MKAKYAIIIFVLSLIVFLFSTYLYFSSVLNYSSVYLKNFAITIDKHIENRIGIITELSNDFKINDYDYSNYLKMGPNSYLPGISTKEYSLKYVTKESDKLILIEIPFSAIVFPSDDYTVTISLDGKIVYSNNYGLIGALENNTIPRFFKQSATTNSKFDISIIPTTEITFFRASVMALWGFVPLIAFLSINRIHRNKQRDLERATEALETIINDMIMRVETGEHVEYKPIETEHEPLRKIQQALENLFSRYVEAIEGYKSTTEELENTMSQIEEMQSALEERNFLLINTLAETVELKDIGTGEHSRKVMQLSLSVASRLGIVDPEELNAIKYGAILHDVGKIGIPDRILLKPGKLSLEEFEVMKEHTILGERVVLQIPGWELVADIVRHHHENVDGSGYPDGLSKNTLSLRAQIVALVDVYIALTEDRPYRKALTPSEALELMQTMVGTKFDPELFNVFRETVLEHFSNSDIPLNNPGESCKFEDKDNLPGEMRV